MHIVCVTYPPYINQYYRKQLHSTLHLPTSSGHNVDAQQAEYINKSLRTILMLWLYLGVAHILIFTSWCARNL